MEKRYAQRVWHQHDIIRGFESWVWKVSLSVIAHLSDHFCLPVHKTHSTATWEVFGTPSMYRLFSGKTSQRLRRRPWFFQWEIIINVLASSLRFIWIPMLLVYGHYKYYILSVRGSFLYVRFWRIMTVPALKGKTMTVFGVFLLPLKGH